MTKSQAIVLAGERCDRSRWASNTKARKKPSIVRIGEKTQRCSSDIILDTKRPRKGPFAQRRFGGSALAWTKHGVCRRLTPGAERSCPRVWAPREFKSPAGRVVA